MFIRDSGSAIDTAKATSIVVACGGTVEQYEGENKSSKPGLPIVAVNTTAGTGSECTSFYLSLIHISAPIFS